jgi:hypothetical protein
MAQAPSPCGTRRAEAFVAATLDVVRPCPARPEYIEVCFTTPHGEFHWCFPEPPRRRPQPDGPIALAIGPYGVQAHHMSNGDLGLALETADALPVILAGAEVFIARRLLSTRR